MLFVSLYFVTAHVWSHLCDGPVGTPAADEKQASETIESLVVGVWDGLLLRGLGVEPRLPLLLVATYLEEMKKQQWMIWTAGTGRRPALNTFIGKYKKACTY